MEKIFSIWPNTADLARDIGENPVTVRAWKNRGSIPGDRDLDIIEAASRRGADLTLDDFAVARRAKRATPAETPQVSQ